MSQATIPPEVREFVEKELAEGKEHIAIGRYTYLSKWDENTWACGYSGTWVNYGPWKSRSPLRALERMIKYYGKDVIL